MKSMLAGPLVVLLVAACTSTSAPSTTDTQDSGLHNAPPTEASVRDGRFVEPVGLDEGMLIVEPAPTNVTSDLFTQQQAEARIWASPTVAGSRSGSVMGFGLVTINGHLEGDDVLRPIRGGPTPERMPAWIGFAWGGITSCPDIPAGAPTLTPPPTSGYEAVVIPADGTVSAFTYSARTSICGQPANGPHIAQARYVVSVPWKGNGKVKNGRVTIEYTPPVCGVEESMETGGDPSGYTISVYYSLPTHLVPPPACPSPAPVSRTVRVANGSNPGADIVLLHGQTGITRQIQLP